MFGPPLCHLDQWLIFYLAQKKFFGPTKAALISGTYINIKTEVNRNSTTSTFLFVWYLDESWDHAVWYYSIEATTTNRKKKINVDLWNNNFKYCFNKLYYDCKHLIRRLFQLLSVSAWYNHISWSGVIVINPLYSWKR